MKRIKYLIITLVLMIPTVVNALVEHDTPIGLFDTDAQCRAKLVLNDKTANTNASNGYYISCIAISCGDNQRVNHHDIEPLNTNVTCANGNINPYIKLIRSAIVAGEGLEEGNACSSDEQDENYFVPQYATAVTQYNCLQNANGDTYTATTTNNSNNSNNNGDSSTTNPQTGINTYYIILGSTVIILSIGLYVINKKNLFKKI